MNSKKWKSHILLGVPSNKTSCFIYLLRILNIPAIYDFKLVHIKISQINSIMHINMKIWVQIGGSKCEWSKLLHKKLKIQKDIDIYYWTLTFKWRYDINKWTLYRNVTRHAPLVMFDIELGSYKKPIRTALYPCLVGLQITWLNTM